ncbi:dihydrofolate reductase family protein [Micromonospora sp. WMMD812]|uniref:dihydrofolate reductase family protein n=1 Tax=Micromonospora sp. WMMD812 TaxID=3015152 RepID=UPI00248AC167|nr:dihydrofolate reductase family protein [Micromonospora sp. WMMD812]WBB68242.1 dihydrofolate reductase family protein [Micromonospora sp. WMMD812]
MANGILHDAYERFHRTGPEWGEDQLTNHGPMAVEVLVRRGHADAASRWRRRTGPTRPCWTGDLPAAVRELKAKPGNELQVHSSLDLVRTLVRSELVDVFRLLVFPVVLGAGRRLFDDAVPAALTLVDSKQTSTGVMVQTYRAAGRPTFGTVDALE